MTADRKALLRTTVLAGGALAAVLMVALPASAGDQNKSASAGDQTGPAKAGDQVATLPTPLAAADKAAFDQHAQVVAAVVKSQVAPTAMPEDQKRAATLIKSLLDQRRTTRADVAGRPIMPLTRREAVVRGLENNLALAIGRAEPERVQTLLREIKAVFDPVLDLSLGYNRADSYSRTRIGLVKPKVITATGNEAILDDPLNTLLVPISFRRFNICTATQGLGCLPTTQPVVRALEFYNNTNTTPVLDTITANAGRSALNKGHPLQQITVTVGLSQELPWGGTLQLTDQTIQQKIYYDGGHYWEDGQYTSNLTGTFNSPVPYTKGFGPNNPHNSAVRNAEINRERADWTLKDLVNQTLRDVDLAYFEVVRQLETLSTTVENQKFIRLLKERQDRILKQDPGMVTRYQEAQIDNEVSKVGIQVEQALQNYLSASMSLALLIGDPNVRTGSTLYLPYAYSHDLDVSLVANLDGALATARVNRPDFYIVKLDRATADVGVKLAENQALPDLKVGASVRSGENGSIYGYSNPFRSTLGLGSPDSLNQNYSLTYTRPWGNRAAKAAVDIARLSAEDQEIAIRDTDSRVKREITSDLATVQSARARLSSSAAEAKALRAAYESLERQLGAGLVSEDQIITALRNLLTAELSRVSAKIDNREAETVLLYAQGTIANVLPSQTAASNLDGRRMSLLADAGYLKYFGPAKK